MNKIILIKVVVTICLLVVSQSVVKAEIYYCWAMSGLLVRAQPIPDAKVLGKLDYGQQVEIAPENIISGIYHKVLFLPGATIEQEETESIYLEDYWVSISFNNMEGFVFRGYLSRWPTFKLEEINGNTQVESLKEYFISAFDNDSTQVSKFDFKDGDENSIVYVYKPGVTIINAKSDKGFGGQYVLANVTINEALLFVYYTFGIFNRKLPSDLKLINPSEHYYGIKYSEDDIEINFPAPSGSITIQKIGYVILITYYGSC
jgi:Bacterial SH3 domain